MLKGALYDEVKADKSAIFQALSVVLLAGASGAIGAAIIAWVDEGGDWTVLVGSLVAWGIIVPVGSVFFWLMFSLIIYLLDAKLLKMSGSEPDWGQFARPLGFAYAPAVLGLFGAVPGIGLVLGGILPLWTLVAGVVAVKQVLGTTSVLKAFGVWLSGLIAAFAIMVVIFAIFSCSLRIMSLN